MRAWRRTQSTSCAVSWRWRLPPKRPKAARLSRLLGADGSLAELNTPAVPAHRRGEMGLHTPGLAAHLWRVTLDKLAVDQPGYESYRRLRTSSAATDPKEP